LRRYKTVIFLVFRQLFSLLYLCIIALLICSFYMARVMQAGRAVPHGRIIIRLSSREISSHFTFMSDSS
jgi:hypothetical protein